LATVLRNGQIILTTRAAPNPRLIRQQQQQQHLHQQQQNPLIQQNLAALAGLRPSLPITLPAGYTIIQDPIAAQFAQLPRLISTGPSLATNAAATHSQQHQQQQQHVTLLPIGTSTSGTNGANSYYITTTTGGLTPHTTIGTNGPANTQHLYATQEHFLNQAQLNSIVQYQVCLKSLLYSFFLFF
jgi:hypothetical protein